MLTVIFIIWTGSAVLVLAGHALFALTIDGCIETGLWTRIGLTLFVLCGPLGLTLEGILLTQVLSDIHRENQGSQEIRSCQWPPEWLNPSPLAGSGSRENT